MSDRRYADQADARQLTDARESGNSRCDPICRPAYRADEIKRQVGKVGNLAEITANSDGHGACVDDDLNQYKWSALIVAAFAGMR